MRIHRGGPTAQLVRVGCDDKREESISLSLRAACEGARLDVVHDPAGPVATQPADAMPDGTGYAWISGISLLVAVGARVTGVAHGERLIGSGVRSS
ncbi:hypothetical protein IU479_28240 [Nocardia abscessus]|uniref:hypothetical protein n=1 Tax=Nocardia TaxID=1817 RepID=UPI00189597F1|nr:MULTISPECIES: hypothetical protein [Nocardia]MBF6221991.1 hypothetical protein [Nocardia abscessus]MDE1674654.1 hypothetical protein [Nocardia gipuzkoensis]